MVHVLGDVRQQREPAERMDHVRGTFGLDPGQDLFDVRVGGAGAGPALRDAAPPDLFDESEHLGARLLGDHVTEQPSQQADVAVECIVGSVGHAHSLTDLAMACARDGAGIRVFAATPGAADIRHPRRAGASPAGSPPHHNRAPPRRAGPSG